MFYDDMRKRKNRALLDAQIYAKRDVNWGCIGFVAIVLAAVVGFVYCTYFTNEPQVPNPPMVDKSRQAQLQNMREEDEHRRKVIPEDPENMCVAWREMDGCIKDGTRKASKDLDCRAEVNAWQTGWCECKDRAGIEFQVPFDCRSADPVKRTEAFTCARTCRERITEGKEKFEKLSRAHQATTVRAETLLEIEHKRKQEAAKRRKEEEERERKAAIEREFTQKGDDLLAEIFTKIESKDYTSAEGMLNEAREMYERAGVLDLNRQDGKRWELQELYKKPSASAKELAISGVADKLLQARQHDEQQARSELEALEKERQRQEAAVRYASEALERRQREQLDELRRKHDERMRELARQAQEEALELMRNKKAIEEEDRLRRSMSAEQLAERERELHAKWMAEERKRNDSARDDPETIAAQRKYAEYLASKKRELDGAPTLSPATADDQAAKSSASQGAASEKQVELKSESIVPPKPSVSAPVADAAPKPAAAQPAAAAAAVSSEPAAAAAAVSSEPAAAAAVSSEPAAVAAASSAESGAAAAAPSEASAAAGVSSEPASAEASGSAAAASGEAGSAPTAGSGRPSSGDDLVTELFAAGLSAHEGALREIGVETVGDLRYLDEGLIEHLPLQSTHKHNLRRLVHKFASL